LAQPAQARAFRRWRRVEPAAAGSASLQQKIQRVVVLLFGVGLTMSRGTEFVILLQFAQHTELFAAMKALHAVSFIGGNGELEEVGKAL
jgi:hypothetical protein